MAKKQDNMVQLALDEHKWINTPIIYTSFGSNFTLLQQHVMLLVSSHLQERIKKFLDEGGYKKPERPKSIFSDEEQAKGIETIRIELKDLQLGATHYDVLDATLVNALKDLWVKAPVFDKETGIKKGEDLFPIFKRIFIPITEAEDNGKRRDGYIDVTINESVAAYAFDMTQGYFNHLERIALFCKSAYTSRLYLYLMQHVSRGEMTFNADYMQLKDYLGMFVREEKSDVVISVKYEKFSQFCKQVLDVAQKDMDRLSVENKTEIVFTYEPIYLGRVKRGDPAKIRFTVRRSELGLAREIEMHRGSSEKKLIGWLLKEYKNVDSHDIGVIVHGVDDKLWDEFKQYVYHELSNDVERRVKGLSHIKKEEIDKNAVMLQSLRMWLSEKVKVDTGLFDSVEVEESAESDDRPKQIMSALETEFGHGQMGYEYFFAKSDCSIFNNIVTFKVNKFVSSQLLSGALNNKIKRCVTKVLGDGFVIVIENY